MMSCISGNSTLASNKHQQEKEQKMGKHVWRPYAEAKAFVQALDLKNQREWQRYGRSGLRPVDIPSNPSQVYGEEFEGMGIWLGQGTRSTRNREFLPFEQARTVVRTLHLKNATQWHTYCKSAERPSSIPTHPQETYKEEFQGLGDWLGNETTSNWDRDYLPFEQARAFVHTLQLKNRKEWRAYCKAGTRPTTIPANPARTYDHEFQGFGDWLGTGAIATIHRTYRTYEQARAFVHTLGLKSQQEWRAYCATGHKPVDIPTSPHEVYSSAFRGWWDWLQIEGNWTRKRLLALLEDLRPHLPYLEERELYALLHHAGALPALTLALGKESPIQAIRALLMQEEEPMEEPGNAPFQEQEEDILPLRYEDAENTILNDQEQANVIFSGDDGQREASPSRFHSDRVPPLTQKGLQVVDQLASIPGILDTETIEYLITNRVSHLWDRYTEAGRAFVETLLEGGEGAFFTTIQHRFLAEVDAVERLPLPHGWSFTDETGHVLHANPMQRRTAWQILVHHRVGNWSGPGAGKTLSAILASRVCDAHLTLVVTNLATITGWRQQIKRAYPDSIVHTDVDDVAPNRAGHHYLLLNYEKFQGSHRMALVTCLLALAIDFIVLDEVHFAKQRGVQVSNRRKALLALLQRVAEQNHQVRVLAMSATPVINTLTEAKALLELMTGQTFPDLETGATVKNALAMHKHLMQHGFRYRPRHAQTVHTDLLPIRGNNLLPLLEKTRPRILAIEQILLTPKLAAICSHLAPGTLVYTHYVREMIAPIRQQILAMGYTVGLYTGADKSGLNDFLQGRVDILLASRPIVIGVDGLQKVCHRLILLSLPWTGAEYEQLVGRAQRQGSVFREIQVIIPQVILADHQGQTWSWDQTRWALIQYKKTLSGCAVDGSIPEAVRMNEQLVLQKSLAALEAWIAHLNDEEREEIDCA
jgi:hypothetical protein